MCLQKAPNLCAAQLHNLRHAELRAELKKPVPWGVLGKQRCNAVVDEHNRGDLLSAEPDDPVDFAERAQRDQIRCEDEFDYYGEEDDKFV